MYNIEPSQSTAKKAKEAQATKVKKSIIYLIKECDKKLELNGKSIQEAITQIDKLHHLTPDLHYLHHALQNSMRMQNLENTSEILSKLVRRILSQEFCPNTISISSVGNSDWEIFETQEAVKLTEMDCGEAAEIRSLPDVELITAKDHVTAALCLIARHDPGMFDEIQEHVRVIKLFSGKITMGFTDMRMLGAMFIRLPRENVNPILYFFEHIIHEASHMHLNCLMATDPMVLNSPEERYSSPLRFDPRPMVGVFHATYVSTKISRSLLMLYQTTGNNELLKILAETLDEVLRGLAEIDNHAKLSDNGSALIASIHEFVSQATTMPEWKTYSFNEKITHRFGAGETNVATLQQVVA
jgi:hypothetical protein